MKRRAAAKGEIRLDRSKLHMLEHHILFDPIRLNMAVLLLVFIENSGC